MSPKSVIIIGGGIAGLSAGCYARMNGYNTHIFELHDLPGGLCTAWERKGYTFDGCIHYLFGSGEGQPFHRMWQELGAVQNRTFIHHDEYQRITDGEHTLIVYTDPDRLEAHLCALSPEDAPLIRAFCNGVRQFTRFDMSAMYGKPKSLMNAKDWSALRVKMLPFVIPMLRWAFVPVTTFAQRFKNPFLRRTIPQMFSWSEAPVMMGMALLASMHTGNAGFPVGGSLAFARAIEQRYLDLGGQITYKAPVEKILVENGRAVGVRLYNDEVHRADTIISTADGRTTLYDFLDGAYLTPKIARRYDGHLPMWTQVQVSLGVDIDFSDQPHWMTYLLDEPALLIGEPRHEFGLKHYCFDHTLAPEGKSSLEIMVRSTYSYWQHIYGRKLYDTEQRQVSDILLDLMQPYYPTLRDHIEVLDEATPISYERFTGNWQGSTTGFLLTRETMPMMLRGLEKQLPGLANFYMAGHWVEPGGSVPLAAASGRSVIQLLCAAHGQTFGAEV